MFKFNITENDSERIVLVLQGKLDTLTSQLFSKKLEPVMEEANKQIIIDFTELNYIASAGMRSLLLLQKTANTKGGKVTIIGMNDEIRQVFHVTGFDQMLDIQ